jgi:hypothetical protein
MKKLAFLISISLFFLLSACGGGGGGSSSAGGAVNGITMPSQVSAVTAN